MLCLLLSSLKGTEGKRERERGWNAREMEVTNQRDGDGEGEEALLLLGPPHCSLPPSLRYTKDKRIIIRKEEEEGGGGIEGEGGGGGGTTTKR